MTHTLHLYAADPDDIRRAADLLRTGGTVAFPTETVYGLGANALAPQSVGRIFAAKQRPSWDPLIVHVTDLLHVLKLVELEDELTSRVAALADSCWPGPLTLLLPRSAQIPDVVTAGRSLVGVRVPAHPVAQALLRAAGIPVAAPSANLFGHTSPTTAQHVLDDLDGRIDAVLDGGAADIGVESSVLDPCTTPMTLYRPGGYSAEMLGRAVGANVSIFDPGAPPADGHSEKQEALPAPGVGLRHYAPHAQLVLSAGSEAALQAEVKRAAQTRRRVGVLLPTPWSMPASDVYVERWAEWSQPEQLAAALFGGLRALDACGVDTIVCPLPGPGGLYDAIRDRLQKASRHT